MRSRCGIQGVPLVVLLQASKDKAITDSDTLGMMSGSPTSQLV